jgi:hypothetical protein
MSKGWRRDGDAGGLELEVEYKGPFFRNVRFDRTTKILNPESSLGRVNNKRSYG